MNNMKALKDLATEEASKVFVDYLVESKEVEFDMTTGSTRCEYWLRADFEDAENGFEYALITTALDAGLEPGDYITLPTKLKRKVNYVLEPIIEKE